MSLSAEDITTEMLARRDFARRVRTYTRDFPELNTLIWGEENSDGMVQDTIDLVLDEANSSPPPIGVLLVQNVPYAMLLDGVVSRLLESAAILLARNNLSFSAGGVTIQLDQYQTYMQQSQIQRQRYEVARDKWKVAMNAQMAIDAVGGILSDWSVVNRPSRFYYQDALQSVSIGA